MNNQTHRKSVRERLGEYTAKYIVVDRVEIHVGKRRVATAREYWIRRVLVPERLRKYTAK